MGAKRKKKTETVFLYELKKFPPESASEMALDDPRLQWIRDRVNAAFHLPEPDCFEELLSRGDGEEERKILQFLNQVTEEEITSALLLFKRIWEEEVQVTIPIGTQAFTHGLFTSFHLLSYRNASEHRV